ncbi:MAG TPA: MTAP family purine nucleoside phosphorylase [Solirubrobacteraceae bacterium]|jgi:purine nucleoside phosphorylase|nr:MTAP family purine nucleoside phosphorylase [Solirubrobacteraceae bacterium]
MRIGIITGSGTYALPGLESAHAKLVTTPFGDVEVNEGEWGGVEVVHIARHGHGHERLSNLVNHRANVFALKTRGAAAAIGLTACGAVDPTLELGSIVIFDDLYFPSNRLPDGSLCTFFQAVGDPARAHWILHGGPYPERLVELLTAGAVAAELSFQAGGVYGHVDGPRFNTPAEIAQLGACGVSAVSQTGGPETVLCGEVELPFALVGFVTDYANDVFPGEPTPVATLAQLIGRSSHVFGDLLSATLPLLTESDSPPAPAGTVFKFGSPREIL